MSRIISAAAAIIITGVLTLFGLIYNTSTADRISDGIYEAARYSEADDDTKTAGKIEEVRSLWEERKDIMLFFTSHDRIDDIDESIHMAKAYLEVNDKQMFSAECRRALTLLDHFRETEYPSLNNIF